MTTRRNNSRKFRKTYKRGVRRGVRRGGEGERNANDFTEDEKVFIGKLRGQEQSKKRDPMNVPSSTWDKFSENPFYSDNEHIMKAYENLRPSKGGKTKRKMRKHRK
jgi:hypothetical protein